MTQDMLDIFNMLYTDLLMLQRGDWEPDEDSVQCSIDNINILFQLVTDKVTQNGACSPENRPILVDLTDEEEGPIL